MEETGKKRLPRGRNRQADKGKAKNERYAMIGERLRRFRISRNLTQEQVAEILDMTAGFYGRVERGKNGLSMESLGLLHEKMNVDLNYLLTGKRMSEEDVGYELQNIPEDVRKAVKSLLQYALEALDNRN